MEECSRWLDRSRRSHVHQILFLFLAECRPLSRWTSVGICRWLQKLWKHSEKGTRYHQIHIRVKTRTCARRRSITCRRGRRQTTSDLITTRRRRSSSRRRRTRRVTNLRILGVKVNDELTAADHITILLSSCSLMLYAMRVLRARCTPATSLHIYYATVVSRIEYAAPAWSVMCSAADHARLNALLRRSKELGYCSDDQRAVALLTYLLIQR